MKKLTAPYPYFGAKGRIADVVWQRFGDVKHYIEPFAGSLAVLLARPHAPQVETVNDLHGHLVNYWRAVQAAPEEVARYADWPVSEIDLTARHRWLVDHGPDIEAMLADPDRYDAKAAGWWWWGISQWIGSGWCRGTPGRQLPHLGNAGGGVHRQRAITGGPHDGDALRAELQLLAARLRRVRICCGDWQRVLTPAVTINNSMTRGTHTTAILLDPPYDRAGRADVYAVETDVAAAVRAWAIANGDHPKLRIALCGYDLEMPSTWECVRWKANGGYGSQAAGRGRANASREEVWFSPHCLRPAAAESLFSTGEPQ